MRIDNEETMIAKLARQHSHNTSAFNIWGKT